MAQIYKLILKGQKFFCGKIENAHVMHHLSCITLYHFSFLIQKWSTNSIFSAQSMALMPTMRLRRMSRGQSTYLCLFLSVCAFSLLFIIGECPNRRKLTAVLWISQTLTYHPITCLYQPTKACYWWVSLNSFFWSAEEFLLLHREKIFPLRSRKISSVLKLCAAERLLTEDSEVVK